MKTKSNQRANTELLEAALEGDVRKASKTLKEGAMMEYKNAYGGTAIMNAAKMGNIEIIKLLLEKGADIDARDYEGKTALWKAIEAKKMETARFLIQNGADIEAKQTMWGLTPLMHEAFYGEDATVKLLLDLGANINARDNEGNTALILAARRRDLEIIGLVLEHGADPKMKNQFGDGPGDFDSSEEVLRFMAEFKERQQKKALRKKEEVDELMECLNSDLRS